MLKTSSKCIKLKKNHFRKGKKTKGKKEIYIKK